LGRSRKAILSLLVGGALAVSPASPALGQARPGRAPKPGDTGPAVRRLQVRVAGWYPRSNTRVHFLLDGVYGRQTRAAVAAFQSHYGIAADGVAGRATMAILARLADKDGSTAHFDWSEFAQNRNASCSAGANAYAGTFGGGRVAARRAKRNVRRLMWRLEAVRARGRNPVGINSGFRSVPYNDCIGGAGASQHLFGTAADNRMAAVSNHRERRFARRSQFHGIGCYASLAHNHFDVRLDNRDLPSSRFWWWPERDRRGRDLDASGNPCWGERKRRAARGVLAAVRSAVPGAGSLTPSVVEVRAFAAAGEPDRLSPSD
jgi:zinc D-Ala-D-Ala carboxypeptidase